jgi:multiple sugar transport system substrate-binding protein
MLARKGVYGLLVLGMFFVLSACGGKTAPSGPPTTAPADASSLPASFSFFQQAATPYRGLVLRGITEHTPPSIYVREILAPMFEKLTGIKVDLAFGDLPTIERVIVNGGGSYDFVYVEQDLIYGFLAHHALNDFSQLLADNPRLRSPDFDPIDFTSFIDEFRDPVTNDLYGVPIEGFLKVYVYRRDLFEDPTIQAVFAKTYNYPLAPAVTFDQYRDIAAFFTRYGQEHGLELWGTSVTTSLGHSASFYEFAETIAPAFGVYNWGIDPDTYRATTAHGGQLDSDQAKAALAFWLDMLHYAPPGSVTNTWDDTALDFAAGRVAQALVYGENIAWIATDPTRSVVTGNVGVALPPTTPGVIEDAVLGKGYIGYYDGAAFSIPVDSQHVEAALLWLQFLGLPDIQPEWAANCTRIVQLSTFDAPEVRALDSEMGGYFGLMKRQGHLFAGAPPFPFYATVRDTLTPYLDQALVGDLTPSEALDQAAIAVDEALQRAGYGG